MEIKVKGILSYPHLFTPRKITPESDPKYSASILVAKDDPQVADIQKALDKVKADGFPSGFPANGKLPLKDGAEVHPDDPRMHGYYILNANSPDKPVVVDSNIQPIMDGAQVYPGIIVWASLGLFSYNKNVNKGVGCGLNGIMVTGEEGPLGRLDGRPTAEQMFAGVAATAAPAPVAPAPAPAPVAPAPAPAPVAPAPAPAPVQHQMTEKANGVPYEQWVAQGWTDQMLIEQGYMLPPGGAPLAFQ